MEMEMMMMMTTMRMMNKCPIFSSQLSDSSRKDHTHQHNTETGATDTRDWSRVLLEIQ